jgi:hypothetical protein
LTVFSALKETVSPDFVLNFTVAGFFTVLTATNLTVSLGMEISYHCQVPRPSSFGLRWGGTITALDAHVGRVDSE